MTAVSREKGMLLTGEALRIPPDVRNIANNDVPAAGKATAGGKASQAQEFYSRCSGPRVERMLAARGLDASADRTTAHER